jgi:hypothetical protein
LIPEQKIILTPLSDILTILALKGVKMIFCSGIKKSIQGKDRKI